MLHQNYNINSDKFSIIFFKCDHRFCIKILSTCIEVKRYDFSSFLALLNQTGDKNILLAVLQMCFNLPFMISYNVSNLLNMITLHHFFNYLRIFRDERSTEHRTHTCSRLLFLKKNNK